jgi:hypothetical protein
MHHRLAVLVPLLRVRVHCPRASNGLLPRRSYLVGYVRWDGRSDRSLLSDNQLQQLYRSQLNGGFRLDVLSTPISNDWVIRHDSRYLVLLCYKLDTNLLKK